MSLRKAEKEAVVGALDSHPHFRQSIPRLLELSVMPLRKTSLCFPNCKATNLKNSSHRFAQSLCCSKIFNTPLSLK